MRQRISAERTPPLFFRDRVEAGAILATYLDAFRGNDALVLGIPRGGVPVAAEVARRLEAELNIVVARKLGAPGHEELAIGAVTANGGQYLNEEYIQALRVSPTYLDAVIAEQKAEAHRREETLRGSAPRPLIAGRLVIVVDDGLATGATARAAVRSVRKQQPARLVLALPVGARESCQAMRSEVDDLICPSQPVNFVAVGMWYEHFEPTTDGEVRRLVEEAYSSKGARRVAPEPRAAVPNGPAA
jgi:predicted phosphoribosyltransferase